MKNIIRYVVGVKLDSRLFAEGAYGVLSHEVSTHVQTNAELVYKFVNNKISLSELQETIRNNAALESANKRATQDHQQIANNTGSFNELNTSFLNQIGTAGSGALMTLSQGNMLEIGGEYNKNNDASKPTIFPKNFYNYVVCFLNGMISDYSDPAHSQDIPQYLPSTQQSQGGAPEPGTAPVAPKQKLNN